MKKTLLVFLTTITHNISAQYDCFNNCMERMMISKTILKNEKGKDYEFSPEVNDTIVSNLKGCYFPKTELNNLDSGKINIDVFKGKIVFIHFWFSSCAPCVAEIPSINKLIDEYKNKKVVFLAISNDSRKRILSFLKDEERFKAIQTYIDEEAMLKYFCVIAGYPMNMIIDKEGKVIDVWTGGMADKINQGEFYKKVKALVDANVN